MLFWNIVIQFVVQDVLKRLRLIDDRVINALNSTLPTESFKEKKNSEEQCKEFCDQVCFCMIQICDILLFIIILKLLCLFILVWKFCAFSLQLAEVSNSCSSDVIVLYLSFMFLNVPSVHWRCWLGGRKGIRPVKNWVVGCWCGYLSGARCTLAYGPFDATATHYLLLQ